MGERFIHLFGHWKHFIALKLRGPIKFLPEKHLQKNLQKEWQYMKTALWTEKKRCEKGQTFFRKRNNIDHFCIGAFMWVSVRRPSVCQSSCCHASNSSYLQCSLTQLHTCCSDNVHVGTFTETFTHIQRRKCWTALLRRAEANIWQNVNTLEIRWPVLFIQYIDLEFKRVHVFTASHFFSVSYMNTLMQKVMSFP